VVDVVLANEGVGVLLCVINTLNLDGSVEQLVLASAEIGYCCQRLQGLAALDVSGHGNLAQRKRPHVQIVHVDNICLVLVPDVLLEL